MRAVCSIFASAAGQLLRETNSLVNPGSSFLAEGVCFVQSTFPLCAARVSALRREKLS